MFFTKTLKILFLCSSLFYTGIAYSGSVEGKLISIKVSGGGDYVNSDAWAAIEFDAALVNKPACATDTSFRMVIDLNGAVGVHLYSLAQQALASGIKVLAGGKGSCDLISNLESLHVLKVVR